jgi:hypothetical protein
MFFDVLKLLDSFLIDKKKAESKKLKISPIGADIFF